MNSEVLTVAVSERLRIIRSFPLSGYKKIPNFRWNYAADSYY